MPLKLPEPIEEPNLNLTPMIDIVFLLIIFFMVGTQFTERETQYDIDLATVSSAQPLTRLPDELVVNILADGNIVLLEKDYNLAELEKLFVQARENYPGQAVVIRGDRKVPYQRVMDVMAVCHRSKITKISLSNYLKRDE
ncbi:MAG: biopolymer transporter ExbD [Planctomycetaceae bacterium]|nr:biopolymer transporter ExbD [Planctomycetaceae bacterium]